MGSMEHTGKKLAEGKTKIIWDIPSSDEVLIESKDDITAGDGVKRDVIEGKAVFATQTTSNCFELLTRAGIPNHFVKRETERMFRAKQVDMIPIELVARRVAYGSYLKRNPATVHGRKFQDVEFEMFTKDDPNNDPIMPVDFKSRTVRRYSAKEPISSETLIDETPINNSPFSLTDRQRAELQALTVDTFEVLEVAWADQDVTLVDLKIECGVTKDGNIIVADVVDNDSWRLWPGGDPHQMVDKQLYRDGQPLDYVADRYAWVAEATNQFSA